LAKRPHPENQRSRTEHPRKEECRIFEMNDGGYIGKGSMTTAMFGTVVGRYEDKRRLGGW
jgi:hypothetical protein